MLPPTLESATLPDGYRAAVRWWRPERARGAALYFHGIQSHGGWYERSAAALAEAGIAVLMPDRRGSGLNQADRGHADSADQALDDARALLVHLLRETGLPSAHVIGVSWGGKLAALLAAQHPDRVASLTLIAPGIFPRIDLPAGEKLRVALALVNQRHRLFDIPLQDPRLFTANPEKIEYVASDPLTLRQVTAGFLLASHRLDRRARRLADSPWRGPVHVLLAGLDRIIDNPRTRSWVRGLPSPARQITEYPGAEHTLEFEPDPSAFLADLTGWIAGQAAPAGRRTPDPAALPDAAGGS
jgi:alpha-beta hydrolase superfamily lysophospholipase